jgi:hypothetical protein
MVSTLAPDSYQVKKVKNRKNRVSKISVSKFPFQMQLAQRYAAEGEEMEMGEDDRVGLLPGRVLHVELY